MLNRALKADGVECLEFLLTYKYNATSLPDIPSDYHLENGECKLEAKIALPLDPANATFSNEARHTVWAFLLTKSRRDGTKGTLQSIVEESRRISYKTRSK